MQFFYYIKGCLLFVIFTLITHTTLIAQTPRNLNITHYYSQMIQNQEWIKEVLSTGTNPNLTNEDGYTPLMLAVGYALNTPSTSQADTWTELVIDLLTAGANPIQPIIIGGILTNPLMLAFDYLAASPNIVNEILLEEVSQHTHRVKRIIMALIRARSRLGI